MVTEENRLRYENNAGGRMNAKGRKIREEKETKDKNAENRKCENEHDGQEEMF